MNAFHTPGPWEAIKHTRHSWEISFNGTGMGVVVHLARTNDDCKDYQERTASDARLIAAAPEMLEALKCLKDCIYETWGSDAYLALKAAREAISKAEGESK